MSTDESLWPISRVLLTEILSDRITDCFVARLVWERLGYQLIDVENDLWHSGENTPFDWKEKFPEPPQIISQRKASVQLTRSIPKEFKQVLKEKLNFQGYRIDQLIPRKLRRATAVNWLLAWLLIRQEELPEKGPLPELFLPPSDPVSGHPGDPPIF